MTVQLAIVVFPRFDASDEIEHVRRRFDPLAGLLDAHVTLVFPFDATLGFETLRDHIVATTQGIAPFDITLTAPMLGGEGYLLLNVLEGRDRIRDLHDRLYSGPLLQHLSKVHAYAPHVTVGRLASAEQLAFALEETRTRLIPPVGGRVDSIAAFRLENGRGAVEFTIPLGNAPTVEEKT